MFGMLYFDWIPIQFCRKLFEFWHMVNFLLLLLFWLTESTLYYICLCDSYKCWSVCCKMHFYIAIEVPLLLQHRARIRCWHHVFHSHTTLHWSLSLSLCMKYKKTTCLWRFVWYVQHTLTHTVDSQAKLRSYGRSVCVRVLRALVYCNTTVRIHHTIRFRSVNTHQVCAAFMYTHTNTYPMATNGTIVWTIVSVYVYAACLWHISFTRSLTHQLAFDTNTRIRFLFSVCRSVYAC